MPRPSLFALLLAPILACSGRDGATVARAADAASLQPSAQTAKTVGGGKAGDSTLARADVGRIIGSEKAKVWMIIISDFQCPYCKRWHDEAWEAIRKEYVETGKLRVAYVNLPLSMHANAQPAAEVAMCAAVQGKFWPVQDALFIAQGEWSKLSNPTEKFESLAAAVGVDVAALRACVAAGTMRPLIAADVERASSAGASSTPTFFIGGRALLGAQPLPAFRGAIDAALAAAAAGR